MAGSFVARALTLASTILLSIHSVSALGSSCSTPLSGGTATAGEPFWLGSMTHQGTAPFNANPSTYTVFRNVMDYGATGNGVTDDTAAINAAMTAGNRCGAGCASSTLTPAIIYFPPGTYLVSTAIPMYYYTQMIGDARTPPTILAAPSFSGMALFDADPYYAGTGNNWYVNQDNFFRSVRNFVFDLTQSGSSTTALHWQVSQATSLLNLVFKMTTGSSQQGIFMDNGSGGMMGDMIFNGGKYGMFVGNQQFTVRNATFNNVETGIYMNWNWGWTFQGMVFNDCQVGIEITTGGNINAQTSGGTILIDTVATNTPILVQATVATPSSLAGSILIDNAVLSNVPTVVGVVGGGVVYAGSTGSFTVAQWGQGNVYSGTSGTHSYVQETLTAPTKPASLLNSNGKIVTRHRPQYEGYATSQFVSVKSNGAKGDGKTDDTAAIQSILAQYAGCKIIFFDAGVYLVSSTITIPAGTQIVGEIWAVLMGYGSNFENIDSPQPVFQVGTAGSTGTLEISDIIFSTRGPAPGAIVVEWNAHDPSGSQASVGAWDSHIRLGGVTGTNLDSTVCSNATAASANCYAAFLGLHLTSGASAYIEGMWVWLADHDFDNSGGEITAYSGRGIYSQSQGPVWLIGTAAEHHSIENYALVGAANHYLGLIQTETPYYQPGSSSSTRRAIARALGDARELARRSETPSELTKRNPTGWTNIGCAEDQASPRLLAYSAPDSSTNSAESCTAACSAAGYTIAGMEYGNECWCGNSYGFTLTLLTNGACNTDCPGNSAELCGGTYAINVWQQNSTSSGGGGTGVTAPAGWEYVTCALDQGSPRLLSHETTSSAMTIELCTSTCLAGGYKLAGVEYADECYCDNQYEFTLTTEAQSSCDIPCAGNSAEMCGGSNRLSVFQYTGSSSSSTTTATTTTTTKTTSTSTSSSVTVTATGTPGSNPFPSNPNYNDPNPLAVQAWGLRVVSSTGILVYGAGHYSFFQDYNAACIDTYNCQSQIVTIDTASHIYIYQLSTVGTVYSLSSGTTGFALGSSNVDGFADTITAWSQ